MVVPSVCHMGARSTIDPNCDSLVCVLQTKNLSHLAAQRHT